ncbi:hypothetical protein PAXRUDRAFT_157091, partial [Paxillus rubicundulus Ve08.2h10]
GSMSTHAWFMCHLCHIFPTSFVGNSMHAGGTTSVAAAGVPPSQIQVIGHWQPATWEHYVCKNLTLLQLLLFHGSHIHDLPFALI